MRTINQTLHNRLLAQADEADVRGLTKIATHLTEKVEKADVRSNTASYTYSDQDFSKDVEAALWDAVVRVADYHNTSFDAVEAQELVEKFASELIAELRLKANVEHGVGAYEPTVPGESRATVVLTVEEEND